MLNISLHPELRYDSEVIMLFKLVIFYIKCEEYFNKKATLAVINVYELNLV